MKLLFMFLLSLVGMLPGCPSQRGNNFTPEQQKTASVMIDSVCGTGSGVIVDKTHVVTATHVVLCEPPYLVTDTKGNIYIALPDIMDLTQDVTRLVTTEEMPSPGNPSLALPVVGSTLCAITAYPKFEKKCDVVTEVGSKGWELRSNIKAVSGNSGSGIWDTDGNLVGIVSCTNDVLGDSCGTILINRPWAVYP